MHRNAPDVVRETAVFKSAVAVALLGTAVLAGAAERGVLATVVKDQTFVIRGLARFDAKEGIELLSGDLLRTGAETFVRIECEDGIYLDLGPVTQVQLRYPVQAKTGGACPYLLVGWRKIAPGKAHPPGGAYVGSPRVNVLELNGVALWCTARRPRPRYSSSKAPRGQSTAGTLRPLVITDPARHVCHSTVDAVTGKMVDQYGVANGFGWNFNESVGAQVLSVPTKASLARARTTFITFIEA